MALQSSGSISLGQINTELGRSSTSANTSLDAAENGTYATINTCSIFRPNSANSAKLSEWYSYNHTQPCAVSYCAGYSDTSKTEVCSNSSVCSDGGFVMQNHDYTIIRFNWVTGSGSDLDVLVGFTNTGVTGIDSNWIGYGEGFAVPDNYAINNSYLYWNADNTGGTGLEAISANYTKMLAANTITTNPIRLRFNAWWYNSKGTGDVTIEILTFSGGDPIVGNNFNVLPGSGSTLKDYIVYETNIDAVRGTNGIITTSNSTTIGYINYDINTKRAFFSTT